MVDEKKLAEILDELVVEAKEISRVNDRDLVNCIMTMLRKPVQWYVDPASKPSIIDHREANWNVQLRFWSFPPGEKYGEDLDFTEPDLVRGFDGIVNYLREWIYEMHEKSGEDLELIPEFTKLALQRRLGGMRPAISRGGGRAVTTIPYMVGDWNYSVQLWISRENVALTPTID